MSDINIITTKNDNMNNSRNNKSMTMTQNTNILIDNFQNAINQTEAIKSQIAPLYYKSYSEEIDSKIINNGIEKPIILDDNEIERIKISNEVLVKANLELKNKNKLLLTELDQYKNNSLYKDPFTQYDANINTFITDLKRALDNSQRSNGELENIIKDLQNKNTNFLQENKELLDEYNSCRKLNEKLIKENSELKVNTDLNKQKMDELVLTINKQNEIIKNMDSDMDTKNKEITYLKTVSSSNNESKNDLQEVINQLQITIDNLQKKNTSTLKIINNLNDQIEHINDEKSKKEINNEGLQNEIYLKNEEIEKLKKEVEHLNVSLSTNKNIIIKKDKEIQNELFQKEKLNTEIESLNLFLLDRQKTIENLKTSIKFLTKTCDNDITNINVNNNLAYKNLNLNTNGDILVLNKKLKNYKNEIINLKQENHLLLKENEQNKKDFINFENSYSKIKNEYQLLFQKFKEQSILIENIKNDYIIQKKDNELVNIIKSNENITQKLNKIQSNNLEKDKEIENLKSNNQYLNSQLNKINNKISNITDIPSNAKSTVFELSLSQSTNRNEKNTENSYIYTINQYSPSVIICFDLVNKIFKQICYEDKTNNQFISMLKNNAIINGNNNIPTAINTNNGLYIVLNNILFFYNSENNTLNIINKLINNHNKCSMICIGLYLYIISGEQNKSCEKINLYTNNSLELPNVNIQRINSGICNINNEYIYVLFGENTENSIEKLDLKSEKEWINITPNFNGKIQLKRFTCFSFGENIIFFGGENNKNKKSSGVYLYETNKETICLINEDNYNEKGKMIGPLGIFKDLAIQIEEDLYCNFDIKSNLHVFNKLLGFYQVYKKEEIK